MPRYLLALSVLVAAHLTAGCIVKEATHRLYLSPDGAATWSVVEQDVRSDEQFAAARLREEQTFLDQLAASAHPTLEGLRQLDPDEVSMRLLRRERPFTVMTSARFARADALATRLLEELHIPGRAVLERQGDLSTLSIALDLSRVEEGWDAVDTPVAALVEDLDRYQILLTEGRFVSTGGFRLVRDGAAATLDADDVPLDRPVALTLTWRAVR
jgi:hypothetical protein